MKKFLVSLVLTVIMMATVISPVLAETETDWYGVGTLSNVKVSIIPDTASYQLDFTITTSKEVRTFSTICPTDIVASQIMYVKEGTKYQVRLYQQNSIWYVRELNLILEIVKEGHPVKTNSYSLPSGVFYNSSATGTNWAIRIVFGVDYAPVEMQAGSIALIGGELSLTNIDTRLTNLMQRTLEDWVNLKSLPAQDEARQRPPILNSRERIEVIGNDSYLVTRVMWFAIHVYSLNPLSFTTRFSMEPIIGEWWQ